MIQQLVIAKLTALVILQCSIIETECRCQDVVDEYFSKILEHNAFDAETLNNETLPRYFEVLLSSDFNERLAHRFVNRTIQSDSKLFAQVMVSCQHIVFTSFNATPISASKVEGLTYEDIVHARMLIQRELCFQFAGKKTARQNAFRFLLWHKAFRNDGKRYHGKKDSIFEFAKRDSYINLGDYLSTCSKNIIEKLESPSFQEREYWENALNLVLIGHAVGCNSLVDKLFSDIENPPNLRSSFAELEKTIRRRSYDWVGCPATGRFVWLPILGRITRSVQSIVLCLEGADIDDSIRYFDSIVCPCVDIHFSPF